MSAGSVLIWLAASADAVTSVLCASRAPVTMEPAVAVPAADSVRSTSADSDLIWLAASPEGVTSVIWASRALFRIEFAAPVPTAVRARSTSDEVSFNCAPTSEETDKQRLLRGARAGLNGLAGVDHEVGERAFGILDMGPDPCRQFLGARHQAVAGLPSAALDAAGHGFDARAQQVFELRDAHIDIVGDGADPGFDALVNFLERAVMVSVSCALRPSMRLGARWMRWSTAVRSPARCRRSARRPAG